MTGEESISRINSLLRDLLELKVKAPLLRSQYIKEQKFGEAAALKDKGKEIISEIISEIKKCRKDQVPVSLHLDGLKSQYYRNTIRVRNEDEFVFFIREFGLPDFVLLEYDMDVAEAAYDCAKFLIIDCLEKRVSLPPFKVHGIALSNQKDAETLLTTFQKMTNSNIL